MLDLSSFADAARPVDRIYRQAQAGPYPAALESVLSCAQMDAALEEIASWPAYAPTPLRGLDRLAEGLGLGQVLYKDEGGRFGLGSFKALGGAYAVLCLVADLIEAAKGERPSLSAIRSGDHKDAAGRVTVVTATDGNHGRSVAWGAQMAGCRCRIYIHAGVSEGRKSAMEAFGAEVIRIAGDYDESVHLCASEAAENGWYVVSDTSYEGYMDLPRQVMAGYSVIASEVLDQLEGPPPTHLFVQAGVGGIAAALAARFWEKLGAELPRLVVVEPERAACVLESARQNRPMTVAIEEETVMAGLSCGEVSLLAWDVLSRAASDFLTIGEEAIPLAMQLLAGGAAGGGPIVAGESAVPGLVALIGACLDPETKQALGLSEGARVLLIGCEGATDPEIYRRIVGRSAQEVAGS